MSQRAEKVDSMLSCCSLGVLLDSQPNQNAGVMTRHTGEVCSTDHLPLPSCLSHVHNKLIIQSCIFTTLSLQPTHSPTCCQNRHPSPLPESVRHVFLPPVQSHSVPSTLQLCLPLTIISSSGKENCRFPSQPSF